MKVTNLETFRKNLNPQISLEFCGIQLHRFFRALRNQFLAMHLDSLFDSHTADVFVLVS